MPVTTGVPVIDWFLGVLGSLGYLIVFGATIFENLFVIGSLTPGETIVMAGAFVASLGRLSWPLVWFASVLGTMVGTNISYWGGRRLGRDALIAIFDRTEHTWVARVFRITPKSIADSEQYFIDHGAKTVLIARFAAGFKNFVPVIAGVSRMSVFWFEVYSLLGAIIYTSAMVAIGWVLGSNIDLALRVAGSIGWIGALAVALLVVFVLWTRRRAAYRKELVELDSDELEAPDERNDR